MAKKKLTKRYLESLKAPPKGRLDVYDTDGPAGFHVRVTSSGIKTFALLYRRGGRKRKWTIGRFPALSLAVAREKAAKVNVLEEDPQKAKVEQRRAGNFGELAAQFFENGPRLKRTTLAEWRRIWKAELEPELGTMLPDDITRADIRALLDAKAATAPIMANRILGLVRRIFTWAVETEKVQASPCVGLKKPGGDEPQRERVLSHDEIRLVLKTLEKKKRKGKNGVTILASYGRPQSRAFFRLALLTAARKGELLEARWAHVDLGEKLWTIPETKMGRAHVLPLSGAAVAVLKGLPQESAWVFRADNGRILHHPKRAIGDLRTDTGLDFTIHDLRRTTATGLAQLGVRTEVISAVLNHVVSGPEATRVYQRHAWIPEMRTALERWAAELERIRKGKSAKVAAIR